MGVSGFDGDDVVVKGDDGTAKGAKISSVVDGSKTRLCVDNGSSPVIPSGSVVYGTEFLFNGGNKSMDVNGSGTPQVFEAGPSGGEIWYVTRFQMFMADSEIKERNDFGNIGSLSNGWLLEAEISSTDYQIFNAQTNAELATILRYHYSNKDDDNLATDDPAAVLYLDFNPPMVLVGDNGDKIKATVRDNLNGLNELFGLIEKYEVL